MTIESSCSVCVVNVIELILQTYKEVSLKKVK